jgi:hypothetical protein
VSALISVFRSMRPKGRPRGAFPTITPDRPAMLAVMPAPTRPAPQPVFRQRCLAGRTGRAWSSAWAGAWAATTRSSRPTRRPRFGPGGVNWERLALVSRARWRATPIRRGISLGPLCAQDRDRCPHQTGDQVTAREPYRSAPCLFWIQRHLPSGQEGGSPSSRALSQPGPDADSRSLAEPGEGALRMVPRKVLRLAVADRLEELEARILALEPSIVASLDPSVGSSRDRSSTGACWSWGGAPSSSQHDPSRLQPLPRGQATDTMMRSGCCSGRDLACEGCSAPSCARRLRKVHLGPFLGAERLCRPPGQGVPGRGAWRSRPRSWLPPGSGLRGTQPPGAKRRARSLACHGQTISGVRCSDG